MADLSRRQQSSIHAVETQNRISQCLHSVTRQEQAQRRASYISRNIAQQSQKGVSARQTLTRIRSHSELEAEQLVTSTSGEETELPCLAGGGGGIFFFWQLGDRQGGVTAGVVKFLLEHYQVSRMQFVGASAGALVATIAACEVDPETAIDVAYRISKEAKLWDRRLGLVGIWGNLIRQWLDEILPLDAHQLCRRKLRLIGTDVFARKQVYISGISSRQDLIQANMCSIHIPFFLDYRPFQYFGKVAYVDGSLSDFLFWENGKLLTRGGKSFVLDYSQDDELQFNRLDFVKLRSYESVMQLFHQGYQYAARLDRASGFDQFFGSVKIVS